MSTVGSDAELDATGLLTTGALEILGLDPIDLDLIVANFGQFNRATANRSVSSV